MDGPVCQAKIPIKRLKRRIGRRKEKKKKKKKRENERRKVALGDL